MDRPGFFLWGMKASIHFTCEQKQFPGSAIITCIAKWDDCYQV